MKQNKSMKPIVWAIIAGLFAAIPIRYGWDIGQLSVYFWAGGNFVGSSHTENWLGLARLSVTTCAIALDVLVIIIVYKQLVKHAFGNTTVSLKKLLIISLSLPILLIMAYYAYQYFNDHRSGIFNQGTQECINAGYKGAVGDHCVN